MNKLNILEYYYRIIFKFYGNWLINIQNKKIEDYLFKSFNLLIFFLWWLNNFNQLLYKQFINHFKKQISLKNLNNLNLQIFNKLIMP